MATSSESEKLFQDVIFDAIVLVGEKLYPNQSVQKIVKSLYNAVFSEFFNQTEQVTNFEVYHTQNQPTEPLVKQNQLNIKNEEADEYPMNFQINERQLYNTQFKSQFTNQNYKKPLNLYRSSMSENKHQPQPLQAAQILQKYHPIFNKKYNSTKNEQSQFSNLPTVMPSKMQFQRYSIHQKRQFLKTIKADNVSKQEQQRIRRMKVNALKSTSKFYRHMKCQLIQLQMDQEKLKDNEQHIIQQTADNPTTTNNPTKIDNPARTDYPTTANGSSTTDQTLKDKNLNIKLSTVSLSTNKDVQGKDVNVKGKKKSQQVKSKKNLKQYQNEQLKSWFNKQQQLVQQKYLQTPQAKTPFPYLQTLTTPSTDTPSTSQLRQHYQITKALCLYSQQYDPQIVSNVDPLDNPDFVGKYFNFPQFSRQDKIHLETNKESFIGRLDKSIQILRVFINHGYGLKIYRRIFPDDTTIGKERYTYFIWFALRLGFRQIEKYLIQDCNKQLPILSYTEMYLISMTLYRIRQMYSQKSRDTFLKILRAVFKLENVVSVTRNDIFTLYNQIRKKLVQRRDAVENKLTLTIDRQDQLTVKYYNYSQQGQIDFFGLDNGIDGIKNIFNDQYAEKTRTNNQLEKRWMNWSEQFTLQFLKLYMQFRKLGEIRRHLLKKFKGPIYQAEFNLKKSLNGRIQRIARATIQLMQENYRRYCGLMGINKLNFYQKKLLTMNFSQIRIIALSQQGLDCRLLIFDYYLNNKYGKNRFEQQNMKLIKYRLTYINYIIESMAQLLQHKKRLSNVMPQKEQERFKMFDLGAVRSHKFNKAQKDVIQLEEDNQQVHSKMVQQMERIRKFWSKRGFQTVYKLEKQTRRQLSKMQKIEFNEEQENNNDVKQQHSNKRSSKHRKIKQKANSLISGYFSKMKQQNGYDQMESASNVSNSYQKTQTNYNQSVMVKQQNDGYKQENEESDWSEVFLDENFQQDN